MKRTLLTLAATLLLSTASLCHADQPTPQANQAFDRYAHTVEARIESTTPRPTTSTTPVLEKLTPATLPAGLNGSMLHHWRATVFVPGATADTFLHLLRDYRAYPQRFAPQVTRATVLTDTPDHLVGTLRFRQHHVISVVLDATFDTAIDAAHGHSFSRSTTIREIDSPGTASEHALSPADDHGFLWRQNTYWSWQQTNGGLVLTLETLSLTRDIPSGLGWAVRPFVETIPRESLVFTLTSAANALRR
ncbi:MAG: hypothetical protein PW792_10980 [Acidobacteriaceae bacterium]|nr:hypothetical protein [Acidobacteriaceae bacterium]